MTQRSRTPETVVLFHVGDHRFVIRAGDVEEICNADGLVALAAGYAGSRAIRHTFDRRGRRHLAIDAQIQFRIPGPAPSHILVFRGSEVGLLIGGIDRMCDIRDTYSLPRAFQGAERKWYRGLALVDHELIPILDPAGFLPQEAIGVPVSTAIAHNTMAVAAVLG